MKKFIITEEISFSKNKEKIIKIIILVFPFWLLTSSACFSGFPNGSDDLTIIHDDLTCGELTSTRRHVQTDKKGKEKEKEIVLNKLTPIAAPMRKSFDVTGKTLQKPIRKNRNSLLGISVRKPYENITYKSDYEINIEAAVSSEKMEGTIYDFYHICLKPRFALNPALQAESHSISSNPVYYLNQNNEEEWKSLTNETMVGIVSWRPKVKKDGVTIRENGIKFDIGANVNVSGGASGGGGGVGLGSKFGINRKSQRPEQDVIITTNIGIDNYVKWRYELENKKDNPVTLSTLDAHVEWIWRIDHHEAEKQHVYDKVDGGNDQLYFAFNIELQSEFSIPLARKSHVHKFNKKIAIKVPSRVVDEESDEEPGKVSQDKPTKSQKHPRETKSSKENDADKRPLKKRKADKVTYTRDELYAFLNFLSKKYNAGSISDKLQGTPDTSKSTIDRLMKDKEHAHAPGKNYEHVWNALSEKFPTEFEKYESIRGKVTTKASKTAGTRKRKRSDPVISKEKPRKKPKSKKRSSEKSEVEGSDDKNDEGERSSEESEIEGSSTVSS